MSWCDKLASTPSAGLKLDYHFTPAEVVLDALSPVLNRLVKDDKPKFTIDHADPFSGLATFNASFTTLDGFAYGVDPSKIHVTFQHRMKAKAVSGGPPVMELLSHPLPYTELLGEVIKRLIEASLLIPKAKTRTVHRVGIVSATSVAEEEVPPGIARLVSYMGRPWKGSIETYSFNINAELGKTTGWSDRCIHIVTKSEDPEQLLTLNFDWQRTFTSGRPLTSDSLKEILATAEKNALGYFEDLAEGSRFDEEVISAPVRA